MIPIHKNHPPVLLSQYRSVPNASFADMPTAIKETLRKSLLEEQGGICCYCMSRINMQSSRIEHWECQSSAEDKQLDYSNMMLACHGNEGREPTSQHCDVKKGDLSLRFNPSEPGHAQKLKIRYFNGSISSDDATFNTQLETVLNLNFATLCRNRKAIYNAVINALNKKCGKRWKRAAIDSLIQKYTPLPHRQAEPFCGVALYHLKKWRKKFS